MMGRTGRRRGPNLTRAAILEAARRQFAGAGHDGTSMRAIAAEAGVDPGVVLHFFGSKEELFRQAVGWPFDPAVVGAAIAGSTREELGGRIAETFFRVWEDPAMRAPLTAILRSAMRHEASAALLRDFVVRHLMSQVEGLVDVPSMGLRTNLAAAQLIGAATLRYILQVEPIASAGTDELVAWLTPTLTRYLTGEAPDEAEEQAVNGGQAAQPE